MLTRIIALVLVAGLSLPLENVMSADIQAPAARRDALVVPVTGTVLTGGTFAGKFYLDHFAARDGRVVAVGILAGVLTEADGSQRSGLKAPVELPVSIGADSERAALIRPFDPGATAFAQQQTCGIVHLALIGTTLDVLGLTVSLNLIVIDIDGNTGGPLGNLVCQIFGLLNNVAGLVASLNQLIARLGTSPGGMAA